ncbi:MAG: hypothetical protein EG823_09400 [Actinobacteria bacterium]|nr:hypothetical protein [Actinomycetota bacterium]
MEFVILVLSIAAAGVFFGLYERARTALYRGYWERDELWFDATPGAIVETPRASSAGVDAYVPLSVASQHVRLAIPCVPDRSKPEWEKLLVPKGADYSGHVPTIPIRLCVVGRRVVGVKYSDLPIVKPYTDVELEAELTQVDQTLDSQLKCKNYLLVLSVVSMLPGAYVIINLLAWLFRGAS